MQEIQFHPIAEIFPLIDGPEFSALVADVQAHGVREPIWLYEGKILDGRNRYRAALESGATFDTRTFDGDALEAIELVWSLNRTRRHMSPSQAAMADAKRNKLEDAYAAVREAAKERQGARNDLRPNIVEQIPQSDDTTAGPERTQWNLSQSQAAMADAKQHAPKTRDIRAKAAGTNAKYIDLADKVLDTRPDLAAEVEAGTKTLSQVQRDLKREEMVARLEDVSAREVKAAQGVYDVIVIDPPWDMQKIERDVTPNQVAFDYPTMSEAELAGMSLPAADDCHVWVWTTHKHLPMALRLLDAWRLKYVCTFVWHKPGGFQPFGLPQYNCEFALYARKGSPKFIDFKAFPVCFSAPRTGHSEKPEEFYDVVRRVTAGRRIDMFSRRVIDGFDGWGNESD